MVAEKFQILGVKITRKYICELKSWICLLLLMPPKKITQVSGNYPFPSMFFLKSIFPQQKRGRIIKLKKWPKLNFESVGHKFW